MKKLFKSKQFLLVVSAMLCVIIGLLAVLFLEIRQDKLLENSLRELYRTEMITAAESFLDDAQSGSITLAYHHISYAADYASQCGEYDAATMFDLISERVLAGEMSSEMADSVAGYLENGEVSMPLSVARDIGVPGDNTSFSSLPSYVAVDRYEAAEKCANKLFGGNYVMHSGEKIIAGELMFTCENAYALIDEKTALPIEAAISLEIGEPTLTTERCIASSLEFISEFFSRETVASAVVENVLINEVAGTVDVRYKCGTKTMFVSIRADNGRISRFFRR